MLEGLGAALLSGGTKLLGGILGNQATEQANASNTWWSNISRVLNVNDQERFAKNAIQWKVEDARRAGLHPLAALGANTVSFSPIQVGATAQPASSLASALGDMGQDISRALFTTRTSRERSEAIATTEAASQALGLENMKLRNDLLRSQIAKLNSAQVGPPIPPHPDDPAGRGITGGGEAQVPLDKMEEQKPLVMDGRLFPQTPGVSPAQAWEDQYGEISDFTFGPYKLFRDTAGYTEPYMSSKQNREFRRRIHNYLDALTGGRIFGRR